MWLTMLSSFLNRVMKSVMSMYMTGYLFRCFSKEASFSISKPAKRLRESHESS